MNLVYIALGSNLGVPQEHLSHAIERLAHLPKCYNLKLSQWYKTAPIGGPTGQPDYTNAACSLQTELPPAHLLTELQAIEAEAGRVRLVRWGARTLDLDIIWYENFTSENPELTLPHPRAHQRAFVLQPLLDLDADFSLHHKSLLYWREKTSEQNITSL